MLDRPLTDEERLVSLTDPNAPKDILQAASSEFEDPNGRMRYLAERHTDLKREFPDDTDTIVRRMWALLQA